MTIIVLTLPSAASSAATGAAPKGADVAAPAATAAAGRALAEAGHGGARQKSPFQLVLAQELSNASGTPAPSTGPAKGALPKGARVAQDKAKRGKKSHDAGGDAALQPAIAAVALPAAPAAPPADAGHGVAGPAPQA
ncbi:MAG: hypothetical protein M0015_08040, partial [Betaproteobacteria bacterium]|nr:hypothetical protein [Betaproteobacteria bacterium]